MPRPLGPTLRAIALACASVLGAATIAAQTRVQPILAFPEAGLDDPAAYQGYQTRFFRDTKGNVVQVYLDPRTGRVVNLLADAIDESVGFTVRDGSGKPIRLEWGSTEAIISQNGDRRTIEYQLVANSPQLLIGWILLGSMRIERDLGYSARGLEVYDWPTFRVREEEELVTNVERLDPAERQRQLGMLGSEFTAELRARLEPDVVTTGSFSARLSRGSHSVGQLASHTSSGNSTLSRLTAASHSARRSLSPLSRRLWRVPLSTNSRRAPNGM